VTLHPQAAALLRRVEAQDARPVAELTVDEARRQAFDELQFAPPPVEMAAVESLEVEGVPVRLYTPLGAGTDVRIVFLHGGGWVVGDLELADASCRALADATGALVASVEYRLAPEHPFPAGLEDCYAVTCSLARDGAVVVAGDSAGGNLAAAACLLARDRGGPAIAGQLLIYPATDYKARTPSALQFAEGHWLTLAEMDWYWDRYGDPEQLARSPYASLLRAPNLAALPPAMVCTAGCDLLRDEAEAFAARLLTAGVPTYARRFPGQLHGFFSCGDVIDAAQHLVHDAAVWLRALVSFGRSADQ
jgi:acetyl esterase